jgi:prophage antirepressor-like protein
MSFSITLAEFSYNGSNFEYHLIENNNDRSDIWIEARVFAKALGYSNCRKALYEKVSNAHKRQFSYFRLNYVRCINFNVIFINNCGLYELITRSRFHHANDFLCSVYMEIFPEEISLPRFTALRVSFEQEKQKFISRSKQQENQLALERKQNQELKSDIDAILPHAVIPLKDPKLRPHLAVIAKNGDEVNPDGSIITNRREFNNNYFPLIVIRGQRDYVEDEIDKILDQYPRGELCHFAPDPNPVVKINYLKENGLIRKYGNEVMTESISVFETIAPISAFK